MIFKDTRTNEEIRYKLCAVLLQLKHELWEIESRAEGREYIFDDTDRELIKAIEDNRHYIAFTEARK